MTPCSVIYLMIAPQSHPVAVQIHDERWLIAILNIRRQIPENPSRFPVRVGFNSISERVVLLFDSNFERHDLLLPGEQPGVNYRPSVPRLVCNPVTSVNTFTQVFRVHVIAKRLHFTTLVSRQVETARSTFVRAASQKLHIVQVRAVEGNHDMRDVPGVAAQLESQAIFRADEILRAPGSLQ